MSRIVRIRESGLYGYWVRVTLRECGYYRDLDEGVKQDIVNYSALTLHNSYGLLYLLFIGLSIAFIIFLSELFEPFIIINIYINHLEELNL